MKIDKEIRVKATAHEVSYTGITIETESTIKVKFHPNCSCTVLTEELVLGKGVHTIPLELKGFAKGVYKKSIRYEISYLAELKYKKLTEDRIRINIYVDTPFE